MIALAGQNIKFAGELSGLLPCLNIRESFHAHEFSLQRRCVKRSNLKKCLIFNF